MTMRSFASITEALAAIALEADRLLVRAAPMEPPIGNGEVRVRVEKLLDAVAWLAVNTVEIEQPQGY